MTNSSRSGKIIITQGLLLLSIVLLPYITLAQIDKSGDQDTVKLNKNRLIGIVAGQGAIYLGSLGSLYFVWYKNYPHSSFHFFNDNNEWQQMDKCGHTTTAYNVCRLGYESYRWVGMNESQSTWVGGLLGLAYLLNIETLDGFSKEWGFSPGDLTANVAGCLFFLGQQLAWHEQRFILKYSYHPTKYTKYNPSDLGQNWAQALIKDYNGQSYWVSCNIYSFLPKSSKFPKWFNVAFGYGAEGMTGATINPKEVNNIQIQDFTRYRKFYISLDADLTRIPTKSKFLKGIFTVLGFIKIPSPSVEFNTLGKIKIYPFYF